MTEENKSTLSEIDVMNFLKDKFNPHYNQYNV